MGGSNCPETPRQKMIQMMYLVLTALLALNVSAEIINAFVLFDETLTQTRVNFQDKNAVIYGEFDKAYQEKPKKVGPWKEKADEVRKQANDLVNLMQEYKNNMVTKGGGLNEDAMKTIVEQRNISDDDYIAAVAINKKDDLNVGSEIMIGADEKGKGIDLRKEIEKFREYVLSLINEKDGKDLINSINQILNTSPHKSIEGKEKDWHLAYFSHMPLVACVTSLSKLQSDVRNAEADVINYLFASIEGSSYKFNKLAGTVIPKSNYILAGNTFEAEIFLAAFDTAQKPEIYVGEYDSTTYEMIGEEVKSISDLDPGKTYFKVDSITPDGKGIYKVKANSVGYRTLKGIVNFKTLDGRTIKKPFETEYQVANTGAVVSPTKMNVFYIGVDNPVDISVPGVAKDKVSASMSGGGGRIYRKGEGWVVKCSKQTQNAYINVSAKFDGKTKSMGRKQFRVKRVPRPVATIGNQEGGKMTKGKFAAQAGVIAKMKNFDFELRFKVVKFTVEANIDGFMESSVCTGSRFNSKAKQIIRKAKRGSKVYISDIRAKGAGEVRKLGNIDFKLL